MCGRFTFALTPEQFMEYLGLTELGFDYEPRYNIAPRQLVTAVIGHQGKRRAGQLQWGLIPPWSKDEKIASKLINARSETVMDKPSFKQPFLRKRCLIPADGFYEWKTEAGRKQPLHIKLKSRHVFCFAGLYDTWIDPEGEKHHTCTILTTSPNAFMESIHHRMPVILTEEEEQKWLDTNESPMELLKLLDAYPADDMTAIPVSPLINSVHQEGKQLIEPFSETLLF
ncbi:SOS response-associated peptidase [Marinicrinis lubricantis]|uniref:Abasic site processing protein n=1 Tax=Marinicrinis lubricantis TaxID=2086470 RepID=A0ABW1IJI2_9BACL